MCGKCRARILVVAISAGAMCFGRRLPYFSIDKKRKYNYCKACPDSVKKDGHFCSKSLVPPGGKFKQSNLRFDVWPLTEMSLGSKCADFHFQSCANTNLLI